MEKLMQNFKPIVGFLIILMAFMYYFTILLIEKQANQQVLIAIVGVVGTVTGYYFGSSTTGNKKINTGETTAEITAVITKSEE